MTECEWLTAERIGLSLNIIGTLFVAFSFGKHKPGAHYNNEKTGKPVYMAEFSHPAWPRWPSAPSTSSRR